MKKFVALISAIAILVLMLSGCSLLYDEDADGIAHDFRECDWGMSRTKVTEIEGDDFVFADDDMILYAGEMHGRECDIDYYFEDGKLVSGKALFAFEDSILSDLCDDYVDFRNELIEKYGEPLNDDYRVYIENDSGYKEDNKAIYYQELKYVTEWVTDKSKMTLWLDYGNEQINYALVCSAIDE